MNIIVTGSLGYIGKPLTEHLVKNGHQVTVISSDPGKKVAIESMGADAAIGNMADGEFLKQAFQGADAAYCMLAPYGNFADPDNTASHIAAQAQKMALGYVAAIKSAGIKKVVYLSSIGAHLSEGNGLIKIHHQGEQIFNQLPDDVRLSILRPSGFMKNLFAFIPLIKHRGVIAAGYGGDDRNILVSNIDIADVVVEELEASTGGRKIRYVASDVVTCNKIARVLGETIGKPELQWLTLSQEEQFNAYKNFMNENLAHEFTEMNAAIHSGKFYEDYDRHPAVLGKVKLADFAKQFAEAYQQ